MNLPIKRLLLVLLLCAVLFSACADEDPADDADDDWDVDDDDDDSEPDQPWKIYFVQQGVPLNVRVHGEPWVQGEGYLQGSGKYDFLHGNHGIGQGDFTARFEMTSFGADGAIPSVVLQGNSYIYLSDAFGKMVLEGPLFAERVDLGRTPIEEGRPFILDILRIDDELQIHIDGRNVYSMPTEPGGFGTIGLNPHNATIILTEFWAWGFPYELAPEPAQVDVFVAGEEGYHTFRIPALCAAADGTILAFCEGRKDSQGDSGDIDLVLKRSTDNGATWGPLQVVVDRGGDTCGNPVPIVDRLTGDIVLPFTTNQGWTHELLINVGIGSRDAWVTRSSDGGLTWSEPVDITPQVKLPQWRWYATGPCHGIQLADGRMLAPCDHTTGQAAEESFSHVIYSDDGGFTWSLGGIVPGGLTNESTMVELENGALMLNMRSMRGHKLRAVSVSPDRGQSWGEVYDDPALVEPVCQGSIIRLSSSAEHGRSRILFSNPASTVREVMAVRMSCDEGMTWPVYKWIHPGPAAYSDLVVLPDQSFGLLYENGFQSKYDRISYAPLSLSWLTDNRDL